MLKLVLGAVLVAFAVSAWRWWRGTRAPGNARHYRLLPVGMQGLDDLPKAANEMKIALNQVGSGVRTGGFIIWRTSRGGRVELTVTVFDSSDPDAAAATVAAAVHCDPVEVDGVEVPDVDWYAASTRGGFRFGDTVAAAPADLAEFTAAALPAGGDAFLAVKVVPIGRLARSSVKKWTAASAERRTGERAVAHRADPDAWVTGLAGAGTPEAAVDLASGWASHLPSWDWHPDARPVSSVRSAVWAAVTGAAVAAAAFVAPVPVPAAVAVAAGIVTVAAAAVAAVSNPAEIVTRRSVNVGWVPGTVRRRVGVTATAAALTVITLLRRRYLGDTSPRPPGMFPYPRRLLAGTREHVAMLAATSRDASLLFPPSAVRQIPPGDGALLGVDPDGGPVRVADVDRAWGVFAAGDPGTGKSTALLTMFAGDVAARRAELDRTGTSSQTVIWFETKGSEGEGSESEDRALVIARQADPDLTDDDVITISLGAPDGPHLVLPPEGPAGPAAQRLVEAMEYAFAAGSIQYASKATLRALFAHALCNTAEDAAAVGLPARNVMALAHLLAEGEPGSDKHLALQNALIDRAGYGTVDVPGGDATGASLEDLYAEPAAAAAPPPADTGVDTDTADAIAGYRLFMNLSARERERRVAAPFSKIDTLIRASVLFNETPDRPWWTPETLVTSGKVVIVNFVGKGVAAPVGELAALTLFLIWKAIEDVCGGWQAAGKSVAFYSDELSDIAGGGTDQTLLGKMADQGRSRGLRLVLATQRVGQLHPRVAEAVKGFGTRAFFKLGNNDVAADAARNLTGKDTPADGAGYRTADITGQEKYRAAVRTVVRGSPQPEVFTITTIDDADMTRERLEQP